MLESSGSETEERLEDSLLEPLSEVSYGEREKTYGTDGLPANVLTDDKVAKKSLPDARAKVLHLQRVQRAGESNSSSNDSTKSSSKAKIAPAPADASEEKGNAEEEKEETVNFSLESIIRRGLTDQKLNTNFNNPFKFGKPDDNISLRVNPSANLFYSQQSSSSDSDESDSYESEKRPQQAAGSDEDYAENEQRPQAAGSNGGVVAQKRKRGRPKMTDEEKAAKRARNQSLLQAQAINNQSIDAMATPVDELMAMGHSLFSEYAPKKRGRRRKDQLQNFYSANDSIVSMETDHSQNNNDSGQFVEVPLKKKRGRKPKIRDEALNVYSDGQLNSTIESNHHGVVVEKKKRGRKPKHLLDNNCYVKIELANVQQTAGATDDSDGGALGAPSMDPNQPLRKKRGRKPKSFYQQQQLEAEADRINMTAPADLELNEHRSDEFKGEQMNAAQLNGLHEHFATLRGKKGRKPKGYREWLLQQQEMEMANAPVQVKSTLDHSYVSAANSSAFSDGLAPIIYKKRGRKPRAYYEALQRQQELINSQQGTSIDDYSPNNNTSYENTEHETSGAIDYEGGILTKRVSKPSVKNVEQNKRVAFQDQRIPDEPTPDGILKKKRGRKPKSYYEALAAAAGGSPMQGSPNASNDGQNQTHRIHQADISTPRVNSVQLDNYNKSLQDRNKVLMDILEQRGDEIRTLKLRMSNLVRNDKTGGEIRENGRAPETNWTHAELCKAFSLQRLNIPLFNYMCSKFSIPLPQEDDIGKFVRNVQLVRGLQTTMLHILENEGEVYKDHEKIAVLQVSYIKIAEQFEYDERTDSIWGPHKFLTAIVARGLYNDWSQLIYVNFDVRVTKQNLNSVIEALHKINFSVVACTCNFEDSPNDLWAELDVSCGKNYFLHPITNEQIFAFYYIDDLLVATNKQFIDGRLALDVHPINRQPVMQAIQKNYRKIAIDKGLLEWADADCNNVNAIRTFFSQYTVNLLRISSGDERSAKNAIEFINIIKAFSDIMNRRRLIDSEMDAINFDTFLDFQNKKLDKVYARVFKLQCPNQTDPTKRKFRDAIAMSLESLKMLRKSVVAKFKYPTFSAAAIANEFLKQNFTEITARNNCQRLLPPMQVFRILKEIFLGESSSIKLEPSEKFFFAGPVTAAEVNGRNETFYVMHLISWICETYVNKHPNVYDPKDLKRKLKRIDEAFCAIQNPNFRIWDGAVTKVTRKLVTSTFGNSMQDIIRTFVLQRHLLRIKYLNENGLTKIPVPAHAASAAQVTIDLEE